MDQPGCGFITKQRYRFGWFSMKLKLVGSAGIVTAYYVSDKSSMTEQMCTENAAGPQRNELGFEFLGNRSGQTYLLQTNVYKNGTGGREMRQSLWFDPTEDYHSYSILWNNHHIVEQLCQKKCKKTIMAVIFRSLVIVACIEVTSSFLGTLLGLFLVQTSTDRTPRFDSIKASFVYLVIFYPNYNVSVAIVLILGCELSQHISTVGVEASGTSNMKLALNGCLVIGMLYGANVEIREEVGEDNFFLFGATTDEVPHLHKEKERNGKIYLTIYIQGFYQMINGQKMGQLAKPNGGSQSFTLSPPWLV
ncbi:Xyloglucan endotransglucosylase/hydrolase [Forsythia ovata]|uniref:Alpha-1,4 glucan phosphorylase n=1 Tax=Forsythia ovata TaxID=205694 RepID=A0ABD1PGK7_9LAMI